MKKKIKLKYFFPLKKKNNVGRRDFCSPGCLWKDIGLVASSRTGSIPSNAIPCLCEFLPFGFYVTHFLTCKMRSTTVPL